MYRTTKYIYGTGNKFESLRAAYNANPDYKWFFYIYCQNSDAGNCAIYMNVKLHFTCEFSELSNTVMS